jgi:hypothetical protein
VTLSARCLWAPLPVKSAPSAFAGALRSRPRPWGRSWEALLPPVPPLAGQPSAAVGRELGGAPPALAPARGAALLGRPLLAAALGGSHRHPLAPAGLQPAPDLALPVRVAFPGDPLGAALWSQPVGCRPAAPPTPGPRPLLV